MGELKPPGKPFDISKWEVQDAWEKVKAKKGAPGVDKQTLGEFESDLKNNFTGSGTGCHRALISRPR